MAWRKAPPQSLPCYTFSGLRRQTRDAKIARRVATLCQQSHELITVGQEFLSRFPYYAERSVYLGDGCIGVANSADLYISKRAREIAPAKVVGTWGSEILGQAVTFKPTLPEPDLFRPELLDYVRHAEKTYAVVRREHPTTFTAFRQTQWSHYGIIALEQSHLTVRPPFLANDVVRTVYRAPRCGRQDLRLRLIHDGNPELSRISSDRGVRAASGSLKTVAARFLQEFTFKAEYAYDVGMPQSLARVDRVLSPLRLERLFLGRHKFLHFRVWYRDCLADYVRQILLDPLSLSRPYLNRQSVENIVDRHLKGRRNYTTAIHNLLTLELIHRLLV